MSDSVEKIQQFKRDMPDSVEKIHQFKRNMPDSVEKIHQFKRDMSDSVEKIHQLKRDMPDSQGYSINLHQSKNIEDILVFYEVCQNLTILQIEKR